MVVKHDTGDTEYHELGDLKEKVLQFGKGNFLRAFVDWQIHQLNKQNLFNGKIVIYQPAPFGRSSTMLHDQDNLYTVVLRGIQNGKKIDKSEIISSISRSFTYDQWEKVLEMATSKELEFIVSNTTEAGIIYTPEEQPQEGDIPKSFPAKITTFLLERYQKLGEGSAPGLTIITCELIERNAEKLKEYVVKISKDWNLSDECIAWITEKNKFCSTLVDQIVTGYPRDSDVIDDYREQLGYIDHGLIVGEPYHMFAIDADEEVQRKLPLTEGGLNVKWGDITPHREIKVRLLNGPHTMMFSVGHLYGLDTVQEVMETKETREFIEKAFKDIRPTVYSDESDKETFIESVVERFLNPYNKHYLLDIGLNAVYKFKARLLPSVHRYVENYQSLPKSIVFSMAAMFLFYKPIRREEDRLVGLRNGHEYKMKDNEEVLTLLEQAWSDFETGGLLEDTVQSLLGSKEIWGEDLNQIPDLQELVTEYLTVMIDKGMKNSLEDFLRV